MTTETRTSFTFFLANLTPQQAQFLRELCALFADAQHREALEAFEGGLVAIKFGAGHKEFVSLTLARAHQPMSN